MAKTKTLLIDLSKIEAFIFDVDGTLYDQQKLRRHIALKLACYYTQRPWRIREIKIIRDFRRVRETLAEESAANIEQIQYERVASILNMSTVLVREVIEKWMLSEPLSHLGKCRYEGVAEIFEILNNQGIPIAIFSDYPAHSKLAALGLSAQYIFDATDSSIDRLKPDPAGLLAITKTLGVAPERCLFIGDRDDRDGECARRASMPYLIVDKMVDKNIIYKQLRDSIAD